VRSVCGDPVYVAGMVWHRYDCHISLVFQNELSFLWHCKFLF